jgi:hypothetical protein
MRGVFRSEVGSTTLAVSIRTLNDDTLDSDASHTQKWLDQENSRIGIRAQNKLLGMK